MQSQNRLLDDFAKLLTNAAGAAQGARKEIETIMRQQAERLKTEFDIVPRDDFEAVRAMAIKAREENELLTQRVDALEKALNAGAKAKKAPKKKTASPKKSS